jgi:hypothetical protein
MPRGQIWGVRPLLISNAITPLAPSLSFLGDQPTAAIGTQMAQFNERLSVSLSRRHSRPSAIQYLEAGVVTSSTDMGRSQC